MRGPGKTQDPFKETAITALRRVVEPLVDLMFDTGITVQEFSRLVREVAVRSAAARIARESGRNSNSRVAIVTGLARAEVARILEANEPSFSSRGGQHPARRVLAAWHDNQRFLAANGDPAVLPIFGRRKSFEQLVAAHSGGIPVRAMLDQLTQISAVEVLSGQRVKVKSRVPIFRGMTCSAIANMGERAGDLLCTLKHNLRTASTPLFEGTAFIGDVDIGGVPLVRRQIAEQGSAFIDGATSLFSRSRSKPTRSSGKETSQCRVGVTIYYFEDEAATASSLRPSTDAGRRKNLQRQYIKSRCTDKQILGGLLGRRR
jgi:uncharacterized protein DUF6502